MIIWRSLLITFLAAEILCQNSEDDPGQEIDQNRLLIKTAYGLVEGVEAISATGKSVDTFHNIPYASSPTGENRFSSPKDLLPWTHIRPANPRPIACTQGKLVIYVNESEAFWNTNIPESEDCLYLSVWVPKPRKEQLAVLVYIHGGGFQTGAARQDLYDGSTLASEEQIIVVNFNYRLSSLGFVYLDHPEAPGNVGLMDQTAALRWIKQNIQFFGGDSNKITIAGHSAGGASVGLHLLLESSYNLFQRGIIQSGVPVEPWASKTKEDALRISLNFATRLGCGFEVTHDKEGMLRCLKLKTTEEIRVAQIAMPEFIPFTPVIDGSYLRSDATSLLSQKRLGDNKDIIIGSTSADGACDLQLYLPEMIWTEDTVVSESDFTKVIEMIMGSNSEVVANALMFNYVDWENTNIYWKLRSGIVDFVTDGVVCSENIFSESFFGSGDRVYKYVFDHKPSISAMPRWIGSLHGDELAFLFGAPLNHSKGFNSVEEVLSRNLMNYWGNFVKYGDPNAGSQEAFQWPRYTSKAKETLVISLNLNVKKGHRLRECAFRELIIPRLLARCK